eukprot:3504987-Prymnesium_polylepis.1
MASKVEQLKELASLKESGVLSEEEFAEQKAEILASICCQQAHRVEPSCPRPCGAGCSTAAGDAAVGGCESRSVRAAGECRWQRRDHGRRRTRVVCAI